MKPYPWTQADRTPEIEHLAQLAGEAQADREALAAEAAAAQSIKYRYQLKYAEAEPDNLDMYMVMADGSEVLIAVDVTEAGVEWFADGLALVDNADGEQVKALAADLRRKMPAKYSYAYQEAQIRRLMEQRPRRCNGQFKRQYGDL